MASFSQWLRARRITRLMWVCGPESVLVADVVREAVRQATEIMQVSAAQEPEARIWAMASQPPSDPGTAQLLIIREAQRLRRWDLFGPLAASRELASQRLLFISPESDFTHQPGCGCRSCGGREASRQLAGHLALIRDSRQGQLIRCLVPDDETPGWLLEWLAARLPGGSKVIADQLLVHTGGALAPAVQVAAKLEAAGVPATSGRIEALADSTPGDSLADVLVLKGARAALSCALTVPREDIGRVIGALGARLDTLAALHEAGSRNLDAREVSVQLGVGSFLQRKFAAAALPYTRARVSHCRTVLAAADDAWRRGAGPGVLEMVIVLW